MVKKMLVGYVIDGRHSGIDKYLLGFCDVAYNNGVSLDLLCGSVDPELKAHLDKMGFGLIAVPSLKNPSGQYKAIKNIIKNGGYDSAYFNISEAFNCMGVLAAHSCKLPTVIVHSHCAGVDRANKYVRAVRTFLHKLFRPVVSKKATRRLACSDVAGKWLFDRDFEIIYNAVNLDKFAFDEQKRINARAELGIDENTKVFIHVGHFCYQKNNFFLMDVMSEIVKNDSTSVLLAVGNGPDFEAVKAYAKTLGIQNNVKFLGIRSDVDALLCAADVFLFPSRFEGLSVTCVEAQFSGLYCVFSKGISHETELSKKACFLDCDNAKNWSQKALEFAALERSSAQLKDGVLSKYSFDNAKAQLLKILEN